MSQAPIADKPANLRGEDAETSTNTAVSTSPPTSTTSQRGKNPNSLASLPQNYAARHGLPKIPGSKTKFPLFMDYWRSLTPDQRKYVTVAAYQLVPVFKFPEQEHAVMEWPGETPLGGETGSAEDALLNQLGLGNYFLIMRYDGKEIMRAWLLGYDENLPGFRDYKNHPPLHWRKLEYVDLNDEKNIKCGFVAYLKSIGAVRGDAGDYAKGDELTMAETQANTSATAVLGKIAERAFDTHMDSNKPVQTDPNQAITTFVMDTAKETVRAMSEMQKQNAINVPELVKTIADISKPPVPVDTTGPLVKTFVEQTGKMQETISNLQTAQVAEAREEMREMRKSTNQLLERLLTRDSAAVTASVAATNTQHAENPMESAVRRLVEKKIEQMITGEDDEPPRRRRHRDEDDEDEGKSNNAPFWQTLVTTGLQNAPLILSGLMGLLHNMNVVKTGEGSTLPPPIQTPNPTAPTGYLPVPANNPNPQPAANQNGEMTPQMMEGLNFLRRLEPALIRALEQNETGYEFAETFVKAFGRTGEYGYNNLKTIGTTPLGDMNEPEETRSVTAMLKALRMYPPLWSRIENDGRIHDFIAQFLAYDDLLEESGCPNLMRAMLEFDVETVPDLVAALQEPDDENANEAGYVDGDPEDDDDTPGDAGTGTGPVIDLPPTSTTPTTTTGNKRNKPRKTIQ